MIYGLYAVKDAKSTYMPCIVDYNDASAVRNFEHAVQSPESLMRSHPNDYSLFKVGTFDNETGLIAPSVSHVMLCDASSVLRGD
ncbi:VP5 [Gokushovirus WZ-2015a]|nr:VP5 [Gokushovirus WZ-2015a]